MLHRLLDISSDRCKYEQTPMCIISKTDDDSSRRGSISTAYSLFCLLLTRYYVLQSYAILLVALLSHFVIPIYLIDHDCVRTVSKCYTRGVVSGE